LKPGFHLLKTHQCLRWDWLALDTTWPELLTELGQVTLELLILTPEGQLQSNGEEQAQASEAESQYTHQLRVRHSASPKPK
jgi:hypothetical protein